MNTSEIPPWESLASAPLDAQDALVLSRLAALFDLVDPVPQDLVDRLQFAITLDAFNAEVAELAELRTVPGQLVASRGEQASAVKTLTFTSDSLTTMVTISADGPDRVRIDGWAAPGGGALVELRQGSVSLRVDADEDGRFVFENVEHGMTRFILQTPERSGHPPVMTPNVEI